MATGNPFDLLGDDDNDDPLHLVSKLPPPTAAPKKLPPGQVAAQAQPAKNSKLPSKPLPPAQAVKKTKTSASGTYTSSSDANTSVNFAESNWRPDQKAANTARSEKVVAANNLMSEMKKFEFLLKYQILYKDKFRKSAIELRRHLKLCDKIAAELGLDDDDE